MGVIAAAVRELLAAGIGGEELAMAIERIEDATAVIDEQAERRRAYDRERAKSRRDECSEDEWLRLRHLTFVRDGWKCTYCGDDNQLQADHIVPLARGGRSVIDNLTTACRSCNASKGARLVEDWLACR